MSDEKPEAINVENPFTGDQDMVVIQVPILESEVIHCLDADEGEG